MKRPAARRAFSTGDPETDARLRALVEDLPPEDANLVLDTLSTAIRLARDPISRLDRKIANTALKEMRYAFSVFGRYREFRKVSIFGSARTKKGDPEYLLARDFAAEVAARGWMVVTGAGPGIMEAGHEGAGGERSFGVNIRLPFEADPNPVIAGDQKLMNFKYFFTRKLMFIKEGDAFVLLPGGFGTLDEAFELLTLIQTGKHELQPIVLLDVPGGTFWEMFERFLRKELVTRGYIDESDLNLYMRTDDPVEAVDEVERFYRVYHSQRYVGNTLVLRLNAIPEAEVLTRLSGEFDDILDGEIKVVETFPAEIRDDDVPHLPRVALEFDRIHAGRLRGLIDRLNEEGAS